MYKIIKPFYLEGVGTIKLKTHETDANPVLQFMCSRNVKPAGWFTFTNAKKIEGDDDKLSSCVHEFEVGHHRIVPVEKNTVSAPLIMGFDIEVNSSNPNVAPRIGVWEDKVFQISCVFCRNGDAENSYEKYILSLGKNKNGELIDLQQEKVGEDIEILLYNTEAELLTGFTDLVMEKNPQIITGYNIFSFDLPYMYARAKLTNCLNAFDQCSFIRGEHCKEKEINWSSAAFKNQKFTYIDAPGRLWVDMLPIIQRDYKLENYKLKTVSDFFLGQTKDPLTYKGIFKCYRMFTPESLSIVAKYCVKDSELVVKLFEKLQVWIGLTEMANTCNTPVFTLFTQGQQIKIFSQVYKKCLADNFVIDKDSFIVNETDHYTGAYVFTPVPGLYDMVVSFDFSSLYPSTIIAYNIDYSTLVMDETIPDDKCHLFNWEEHILCEHDTTVRKTKPKQKVCANYKFRFLKEPAGVIPTLLRNLLDARKKTNAEMKRLKSSLPSLSCDEKALTERLITVLDKRQLSYKVSANSVAPNTPIPCIDGDGKFMYLTMEEISGGLWISDSEKNEVSHPKKDLSVWTDKGYTKIKYVIRHPIRTPLKRVLTHTGCVDVTDEHSLLDDKGKEVKPIDLSIGDKLMHRTLPLPHDTPSIPIKLDNNDDDAFKKGVLFASCKTDRITSDIFTSKIRIRQSFFNGFLSINSTMKTKKEISAACLCYLLKTLGYRHVQIIYKDDSYHLYYSITPKSDISIKSIIESPLKDVEYIYDIETENHHFAAGVGDLIVHNSMYGGMGVKKGYLPFLPGAMCTTARGRESIEKASKFLIDNLGAKLIYGDSVTGDTPILVRYEDQTVDILRIDEIGEVWKSYEEFKSEDSNRYEKEQTLPFVSSGNFRFMNILEVWTGDKWSRVRRVIRHKTIKKMYRVLTHTGCVDVTEDHSLLDMNRQKIKPTEISVGSQLYHSFPPKEDFLEIEIKDSAIEGKVYECKKCKEHKLVFEFYEADENKKMCKECVWKSNHRISRNTFNQEYISETEYTRNPSRNLNEDLAFVWGMFFAEGSCGSYTTKTGKKNSWAINNQDLELLNKCKIILEKCEPIFGWKILDTMQSSSVYKLVPCGHLAYIVNKWRRLFYDREGYKKVPYFILNGSDDWKTSFFDGYYQGDGDRHTYQRISQYKFDIKGKIGALGLYTLLHSIGHRIAMNVRTDKDNIYTLHTCENFRTDPFVVKKIISLPDTSLDDFVYDIETEEGRFMGGVGQMILKNTDSCYISFPQYSQTEQVKDLDHYCRQVEDEMTSLFPKPMKFAYEEAIYWRYLILSKKRYMALKCDTDGIVSNKIEKRGVLLSRRDNSAYSRDVYSKIIMNAFYKKPLGETLVLLHDEFNRLCSNNVSAKDLTISKSIGEIKDYKIRAFPDDDKKLEKRLIELNIFDKDATIPIVRKVFQLFVDKADEFESMRHRHPLEYLIVQEYINKALPSQVQLAEKMRKRGTRVDAGERLGYCVIESDHNIKDKLFNKIEDIDYFKEHSSILKIDSLYYTKLLINPVDEVLSAVYDQTDICKKYYKAREIYWKNIQEIKALYTPTIRLIE
jgi:DNA polymerase elongation subunit (family B)